MSRSEPHILSSTEQLQSWLESAPRPLVFTNGCFDILHRGHVSYLERAAKLGTSLLVALNTDASVRRQGKGEDRPLNLLEDRMAVIAALGCVDAVCSFDSDTPLELVMHCQPNILVKGGDWPIEKIIGCNEVQSRGGQCFSIPFDFERSTTALLNKIRKQS